MLALGAFPSTAHAATTSGRQPSVSTNAQPGESEKVRLLLCNTRHEHLGHEQQAPKHEYSQKTHLTSPPTPLQPSLPLVHPTRSLGFRLALDHVPPVAPFPPSASPTVPGVTVALDVDDAPSSSGPSSSPSRTNVTVDLRRLVSAVSLTQRSFSQSSTSARGAFHTASSSLSLSTRRRRNRRMSRGLRVNVNVRVRGGGGGEKGERDG